MPLSPKLRHSLERRTLFMTSIRNLKRWKFLKKILFTLAAGPPLIGPDQGARRDVVERAVLFQRGEHEVVDETRREWREGLRHAAFRFLL